MTRRARNYLPHLLAEWQRLFPHRPDPHRPDRKVFSDEVVCAVNFLMRQIDPEGERPVIEPPMPAEGYQTQPSARGRGEPD